MPMMKFVDFTKTQKTRYLKNGTFFIQIKNSLIQNTLGPTLFQKNSYVADLIFRN